MQVHFQRTDGLGGYAVLMRRDDGLTVKLPGYDGARRVPHDLAHLVAEREFELRYGVFGSIAAGAMFSNMAVVGARPRYDITLRSRAIIKAHGAELGLAEVLAGVVHQSIEQELVAAVAARRLQEAWDTLQPGPCPYQVAHLRRCIVALDELGRRWRKVAVGDRLALRWEAASCWDDRSRVAQH